MNKTPQDLPQNSKIPGEPAMKTIMPGLAALVQQLEDLVKLALECREKQLKEGVSFIEANKKLLDVRHDLEKFYSAYNQNMEMLAIQPNLANKKDALSHLTSDEKKVLQKLENLQVKCEEAREQVRVSLYENKEVQEQVNQELLEDKEKIAKRKSKFKSVGGRKNWMRS